MLKMSVTAMFAIMMLALCLSVLHCGLDGSPPASLLGWYKSISSGLTSGCGWHLCLGGNCNCVLIPVIVIVIVIVSSSRVVVSVISSFICTRLRRYCVPSFVIMIYERPLVSVIWPLAQLCLCPCHLAYQTRAPLVWVV